MTAMSEVQTGLYGALTGDTPLMSLITGVFDSGAVPDDQEYPFIVLGNMTEISDHTFSRKGYSVTATLHIWDDEEGFKRCQTILARMNEVLDEEPLVLPTHHHVGTWYEFSETIDIDPEDLRHMPVRYRVGTQAPIVS